MTQLLSIGTRVTHFDGGPDTHGKGTIVAYNNIKPNDYLKTQFNSAVELAAGAGLLNGLVNSMYDGERCPYVVQWDPRNDDSKIGQKYPAGYKDVYEPDSINEYVDPR